MTIAELFVFIPAMMALLGFMAGRWQNPSLARIPLEV
jgi:hypothetical protein